jgi:hypothetical protein
LWPYGELETSITTLSVSSYTIWQFEIHPDDECKSDRNMLVINNVIKCVIHVNFLVLLHKFKYSLMHEYGTYYAHTVHESK